MMRKLLLFSLIGFLSITFAWSQTGAISGTIKDSEGQALIGANVILKGTTVGTITDVNGEFTLNNVSAGTQTFVASFIGYNSEELILEVATGGTVTANFVLIEDVTTLDELVVIGYGTVKKDDATGSVSTVSAKDFNQGNITSPQDLIVGKTAGVVITSSGGAPGSGSTIRIRGGSSLNASNDPLIIVDGVPLSNNSVNGSSNPLSFINPNDIETFTVLKDASATAIYGSRASNGVILITTKKGKEGSALKVSYNGNMSLAHAIDFVDVYDSTAYRPLAIEKFPNGEHSLMGNSNTDWQSEIFRMAYSQDHNMSISGAFNTLPYRFSVGYTDQEGILKNTDMQRVTGSLNLNPSLFKDALKVNVNVKVSGTKNNFGDDGAIGSAIAMDPTQNIYDTLLVPIDTIIGEGGEEEFITKDSVGYFQWENYGKNLGTPNPVEQAMSVNNRSEIMRLVGNVQLSYEMPFISGLKANLNLATEYSSGQGHNNRPVTSPKNITGGYNGRLNEYEDIRTNNLLDFYLGYNNDFGSIHNIDATAGYSWQHFERESADSTFNMVTDANNPYLRDTGYVYTENYLVSFFGRVNYSLMDKYLLTGTIRYDGSSRFLEGKQWGFFPSAAFAWKLNKEAFLEDVAAISDLKLRLGWGSTGQQDISSSDYPAQTLYVLSDQGAYYPINGNFQPTLRPNPYDPFIKWEETTTLNVALDYGFMSDRITGTFDVYKRTTSDLINKVVIPSGSNFSNKLTTNVGSLENKGVEFSINAVAVSKKDMSLNVGYNFTYNQSEITKLLLTDDPEYIGVLIGDAFSGYNQVHRVGYAPNSFFVNKQIYDTDGNPIEGLYEDISGEGGTVAGDDNDKYVLNNPAPQMIMGFNLRFNYKQFDVAASARANIDNYVQNRVAAEASYDQMFANGYWRNNPTYLDETQFVTRQFTSDYFIKNASFFKLDNISAGYNFEIAEKVNLRLNLAVQNVLTVTKYEGIDPEVDGGIDNNFYPRPRTYTFGLSLNF